MTYRVRVDPEQIKQLNDGEEITVLVPWETQPNPPAMVGFDKHGWIQDKDDPYVWRRTRRAWVEFHPDPTTPPVRCPVAVGDTVDAWNGQTHSTVKLDYDPESPVFRFDEGLVKATVLHIAHSEQPDGHYWEVRLG